MMYMVRALVTPQQIAGRRSRLARYCGRNEAVLAGRGSTSALELPINGGQIVAVSSTAELIEVVSNLPCAAKEGFGQYMIVLCDAREPRQVGITNGAVHPNIHTTSGCDCVARWHPAAVPSRHRWPWADMLEQDRFF
jgi:hypothetical protein